MADQFTDDFGRPMTGELAPPQYATTLKDTTRVVRSSVPDTISPATFGTAIKAANSGRHRQLIELYEHMEEMDSRLQGVLATRRLAVAGAEWKCMPSVGNDARADVACQRVRDELLSEIDVSGLADELLDAIPQGVKLVRPYWEIIDGKVMPLHFQSISTRQTRYWKTDDDQLVLQIEVERGKYENIAPNEFIIHSPRIKSGYPERRGLLRALCIWWVMKHWAMRDWAAFSEVFGMPLRVGKYDRNSTQPGDIDKLLTALKKLGVDSVAAIPEDQSIEFISAVGGSNSSKVTTPMQEIITQAHTEYAVAVLGQNLTTEGVSGTGTLAGNAHDKVRSDIRIADAGQLARTIKRDLIAPWVLWNLGPDYPVPDFKFDVEDPADEKARTETFREAQAMGMTLSKAQLRDELNLRVPEDDEDALEPPSEEWSLVDEVPLSAKRDRLQAMAGAKLDAVAAEVDPERKVLSSAQRANESVWREAEGRGNAEEAMTRIVDHVVALSERYQDPKHVLTRIRLNAPDLERILEEEAGLDIEDVVTDLLEVALTCHLNGEIAVKAEAEV
jgi:phage gp29-like protein